MNTRHFRFAAVLAASALALGACSSDDSDDSGSDSGSDSAALDGVTLVNDGQLTVCSDMPYAPFEFDEDGTTTGFDFDLVSAMGDSLGLETEFVTTPFDSIIPALVAGNCDMIASAMTITPERAEQVNFTEPYFDADQALLVLTENADTYGSLEDLANQTIGVQVETTGASYAEENKPEGATLKEYQTGDDLFPALISGDIQAALQDFPVNAYRAATDPDQFTVSESFPTGEEYGFAIPLESEELLTALDGSLADLRDDGTYDEVFSEWFGDSK